jgi:hypothetical protein
VRIYNRYILTVSLSLLITTVILIAIGLASLDVYYTTYIIEALVITELYVYFNEKARRGLNMVSSILLGGFVIVLCLQVLKILL